MPPKSWLISTTADGVSARDMNGRKGAFWLPSEIPTLADIKHVSENQRYFGKYDQEIMDDKLHIGRMITLYSDNKVPRFAERLQEINDLAQEYEVLMSQESNGEEAFELGEKVSALSQSFGYEVRGKLMESLKEIRDFGHPLKMKFHGETSLFKEVEEFSKFFPSQWNQKVKGSMRIKHAEENSFYEQIHGSRNGKIYRRVLNISTSEDSHLYHPDEQSRMEEENNSPDTYRTRHEIIHELSHMYEKKNPLIEQVTDSFLYNRICRDSKGEEIILESETDSLGTTFVFAGNFSSINTGARYPSGKTEILARGVEGSLAGTAGSLIGLSVKNPRTGQLVHYNPDIGHRDLTIGILASFNLNRDKLPWTKQDTSVNGK